MKRCKDLLGIILLAGTVALAFAQNPATPDRAAALQKLTSVQPMAAVHLDGARIDRLYGAPLSFGVTAEHAAASFVADHSAVFGLPAEDLSLGSRVTGQASVPTLYDAATDSYRFTLVSYGQQRDGLPVYGADLRLLVRNEEDHPVVWVGANLRELGSFRVPQNVVENANEVEAQTAALAVVPSLVNFEAAELVIWAGTIAAPAVPSVAFTFVADNYGSPIAEKPERWRFVVDAATDEVLYEENLIRFTDVTGNVSAMASVGPKSDNCSDEASTPMPYARVQITGGSTAYADASGNFTIPNGGTAAVTVQSFMNGTYFTVDNYAGAEETLSLSVTPPGPANFLHNAANTSEAIRAQVNVYVQAHIVRQWVLTYDPTFPTISTETGFPIYVNRTDLYCPGNAWSDGASINFCSSGSGYPNTAWSSVLHHEYGHHVVDCGGSGQDEYGEGIADAHAVLIADDPVLGYGFYGDCNSGLRNADNDCQYLASGCSTCGSEVHDCGQLLIGAIWSVREYLAVTEPVEGLAIISNLTVNSIKMHSGTSIEDDIVIDFLTLDDTDGNIYNGTPHWSEICSGFGDHGLNCPQLQTGLSVSPTTGLAATGPSGGPFTPNSQVYTLENLGPGAITYTVTKTVPWVSLTNATGALPNVGDKAYVTVSINSLADALPDGDYSDSVQFTNTTDHVGDALRPVTLRVGSNDLCASATVACPGTYTDSTVGMTNDGSASCGNSTTSPDVWYKYKPATSGTLDLLLCDSGYDTVLSIHTGCPGTSSNQLGCNDDTSWFGACGIFPTDQSALTGIAVTAGQTYYIRIAGTSGATGTYVLDLSGPACAPFTGACCYADGSCAVLEEAACTAGDGLYWGDGTTCSPSPCPASDCNRNGIDDAQDLANCSGSAWCDDCNTNGILDVCDLSAGTSQDGNGNGVPDECEAPPVCHGDCNCDDAVNFADINAFVDAVVSQVFCDGTGENADLTDDAPVHVGFEDINPFVELLTTNTLPIPCPRL